MKQVFSALGAFASSLRVARMSRPAFERWQQRKLDRWLSNDLRRVAFYKDAAPRLDALPVIDKATVMERFEDFNLANITASQGWEAFAGTGEIDGISIGASTGTSGNRALYGVSAAERYRWLGSILAKTIPGFMLRRERVAVILPQSSALYDGANKSGRLRLKFFDLREGSEVWLNALEAFDPTTVIAPPRVLRHFAEIDAKLSPRRIYAGAETLDPMDRSVIETYFNRALGQIYMATEGLLGVSCSHGKLHLAEDATFFEFEDVGDGLVSPITTGFRRSFQIMARYRMNDLLRLSDTPCSCGSPLRVVDEVVGRMDDAFVFGKVLITPDIMRNAVLDAARDIDDFRVFREAEKGVTLVLKPCCSTRDADAAQTALAHVFHKRGIDVDVHVKRDPLALDLGRKLRRIENRWSEKS